jgi:hypothetical protein
MKNPIGLNPVEKAQDILNFPGQVDSGTLKEIIRELLVHIAMSSGHKVIADLEDELKRVRVDRDLWRKAYETLALSVSAEVCK